MTLVKRFLESTYEDSLTKKIKDILESLDAMPRVTKLESSDTDGTLVSFTVGTFAPYYMDQVIDEVNKILAKEGTKAYILHTDYHGGTNYDIEEKELAYKTMEDDGTIDLGGHWDTYYSFEEPVIPVELPNGKKAVFIKTKELSSEQRNNGFRQMQGYKNVWLYEAEDPEDGYFILVKDCVHPAAGEDCIATWHSGKYGDGNSMTAEEYFADSIAARHSRRDGSTEEPMNEEEKTAVKKVLHFFINQNRIPSSDFGDGFGKYSEEEVFKEFYEDLSFETALECIANAIETYLDRNPDEKETFGAYTNDGGYIPFTVEDIYEIDDETGLFDLPSRE